MSNNSNPFDLDKSQVESKGRDIDVTRATVVDRVPSIHAVRVNPRGENAPFLAPVLVGQYGDFGLPEPGSRVTVLYVAENVPVVLGPVYLIDRGHIPDLNGATRRISNETGSHITIRDGGAIEIHTDGRAPVDVDHQSADVEMSADQTVAGDNAYDVVQFDTVDDDPEDLFDSTQHAFVVREGGQHDIDTTVEVAASGQNNLYTVAIAVNGTVVKRKRRQSAVNEPLSITVGVSESLSDGDVVDVRLKQNSGASKTIDSNPLGTEFQIQRKGI